MLSVDDAGILDVFAARVRVLAVTRVEIEEEEALEMPVLRVDAVALHVLVPDVGIVDSGKETRTRRTSETRNRKSPGRSASFPKARAP